MLYKVGYFFGPRLDYWTPENIKENDYFFK
jgi:hypothetical protein